MPIDGVCIGMPFLPSTSLPAMILTRMRKRRSPQCHKQRTRKLYKRRCFFSDGLAFAEKAAALPERDMAGLNKILWETMIPDGIEYTIHDRENSVEYSVTKCPWYELAKAAQEFAGGADTLKRVYHMLCATTPT